MEQTQGERVIVQRLADTSAANGPLPPTTNETRMTHAAHLKRPAVWSVILAFTCLYISWGTTYYAIRVGVETLPPALFAGSRLALAGLVLFAFQAARGQR